MHTYSGEPEDPLRFSRVNLQQEDVLKFAKKLLGETKDDIKLVGLAPFYSNNPAPEVNRLFVALHLVNTVVSLSYFYQPIIVQENADWWRVELQDPTPPR